MTRSSSVIVLRFGAMGADDGLWYAPVNKWRLGVLDLERKCATSACARLGAKNSSEKVSGQQHAHKNMKGNHINTTTYIHWLVPTTPNDQATKYVKGAIRCLTGTRHTKHEM